MITITKDVRELMKTQKWLLFEGTNATPQTEKKVYHFNGATLVITKSR